MKKLLFILLCVCFAVFVTYAASGLRDTKFKITKQQFEPGDSIVVQQVSATSSAFKVGDRVVIRGTYHLQSRSQAALGFFLTTKGASRAVPISPKQQSAITAGDGTFELEHVVPAEGKLHVSFYPKAGGSSFGGVYFEPATQ